MVNVIAIGISLAISILLILFLLFFQFLALPIELLLPVLIFGWGIIYGILQALYLVYMLVQDAVKGKEPPKGKGYSIDQVKEVK